MTEKEEKELLKEQQKFAEALEGFKQRTSGSSTYKTLFQIPVSRLFVDGLIHEKKIKSTSVGGFNVDWGQLTDKELRGNCVANFQVSTAGAKYDIEGVTRTSSYGQVRIRLGVAPKAEDMTLITDIDEKELKKWKKANEAWFTLTEKEPNGSKAYVILNEDGESELVMLAAKA